MTASVPPGAPNTVGSVPGDGPDPYRATQGETRHHPLTAETTPSLDYDVNHGFRVDGSKAQWWGRKTAAREGAKAIGWPMNSIERVWTRFQCGYALHATHGGFLTRSSYQLLLNPVTSRRIVAEPANPSTEETSP